MEQSGKASGISSSGGGSKGDIPLKVSWEDIELGDLIKESACARVYKGRCFQQPVAIKILRTEEFEDEEELLEALAQEVKILR